jgi:hypothetical protein
LQHSSHWRRKTGLELIQSPREEGKIGSVGVGASGREEQKGRAKGGPSYVVENGTHMYANRTMKPGETVLRRMG